MGTDINKVAGFTEGRLKLLAEKTYLGGVQPQWMLYLWTLEELNQ